MKHLNWLLLLLLFAADANAQSWITRYESSIVAYEAQPKPPDGEVVVTGNSNIIMWSSAATALAPLPVVLRGFGGSTTAELNYYLDRIVLTYHPRAVVISEGENDFGMGYTSDQINSLHDQILKRIHAQNAATRVYEIGLKPSPVRLGQWGTFQQTNALIKATCAANPPCLFVPPPTALLDSSGNPIPALYLSDQLHLNAAGYKIWDATVGAAIVQGEAKAATVSTTATAAAVRPLPPSQLCIGNKCVTSTTPPPSAAGAIKWHPGVYLWLSTINRKGDANAQSNDFSIIDSVCSDPTITGVKLVTTWDNLEGDTPGDYSAGFAYVDAYLAKMGSCAKKKRLILEPYSYYFGACTNAQRASGYPNIMLPAYMKNNAGWVDQCVTTQRLYSAALWNPAVMDRMIALSAAYAKRYDTNPLFEMFQFIEETAGFYGSSATGYSTTASVTQIGRYYAAAKSQWTHTLVRLPVNYLGDINTVKGLIDSTVSTYNGGVGLIVGGPDTVPDSAYQIDGNFVWRGLNKDGSAHPGWVDYRGTVPWVAEQQGDDACGPGAFFCAGDATLTDIAAYGTGTMKPSHWVIYRNTWDGGPAQQWSAELALIHAGNYGTVAACPKGWTCNTN